MAGKLPILTRLNALERRAEVATAILQDVSDRAEELGAEIGLGRSAGEPLERFLARIRSSMDVPFQKEPPTATGKRRRPV